MHDPVFLARPFEVFAKAAACGEPLDRAMQKLILSFFGSMLAPSRPVLLDLPSGLKAYSPLGSLVEAWLNILHVFYYKDYEQFTSFRPERGWVVVDVGAFLGFYTLRAASLVGPQGLVVSVEPSSDAFRFLSSSVEVNGLSNVKLIKACVASSRGERILYIPPFLVNASILREYAEIMGGVERVEAVKAIKLSDLVEKLGRIDLLKLDVEGAELEVLKGSKDALTPRKVRRLIVETHVDVVKPSEISEILEELGYEVAEYVAEDALLQVFIYAAEDLQPSF